jgi:hypothetical protein
MTFRRAAARMPPQAPDNAAKGGRGLARRMQMVCAAFSSVLFTKGCRTDLPHPPIKTRNTFIQASGQPYFHAMFGSGCAWGGC